MVVSVALGPSETKVFNNQAEEMILAFQNSFSNVRTGAPVAKNEH